MRRSSTRNKQKQQEQQQLLSKLPQQQKADQKIPVYHSGTISSKDRRDPFNINPKKGVNVGKRTGNQVKQKETGLNYDGTEKVSDYFWKDRLSIESDNKFANSDAKRENISNNLSDLQDDSDIVRRLNNKRDSLSDFDISAERNVDNTMKNDRMSGGISEEMPSARKTSSFRLRRQQNSRNRQSIALSSIAKVGKEGDLQSDISSDQFDDFELLGQISNLPADMIAQNLRLASSGSEAFKKEINDFEISLSESEMSICPLSEINSCSPRLPAKQIVKSGRGLKKLNSRMNKFGQDIPSTSPRISQFSGTTKQSNPQHDQESSLRLLDSNDDDDEIDAEISHLLQANRQIINEMSLRKKGGVSQSFNNYLLDLSESRVHKSEKNATRLHDFGLISPIQEVNTQQSNRKEEQKQDTKRKRDREKTEITIDPSFYSTETPKNKKTQDSNISLKENNPDQKIIPFQKSDQPILIDVYNEKPHQAQNREERLILQSKVEIKDIPEGQLVVMNNKTGRNNHYSPVMRYKQLKKRRESLDSSDIEILDASLQKNTKLSQLEENRQSHLGDEKQYQIVKDLKKDKMKQSNNISNLNVAPSSQLSHQQNLEYSKKMVDENQEVILEEQKQQSRRSSDISYNNEMEVMEYNPNIDINEIPIDAKRLSNPKSMEVEYPQQSTNNINVSSQRGRLKRKKITPLKNRNLSHSPSSSNSKNIYGETSLDTQKIPKKSNKYKKKIKNDHLQEEQDQLLQLKEPVQQITTSESELSSYSYKSSQQSHDQAQSYQGEDSHSMSKISGNDSKIQNLSKLKPLKEGNSKCIVKDQREEVLREYRELFEKGFHKNQIEIKIEVPNKCFGLEGRYPVRKRVRPLCSWRERAVYDSKGLLYVIADRDADLTSINYNIPSFSNVPLTRIHQKKDKRREIRYKNNLQEIQEEMEENDTKRQSEKENNLSKVHEVNNNKYISDDNRENIAEGQSESAKKATQKTKLSNKDLSKSKNPQVKQGQKENILKEVKQDIIEHVSARSKSPKQIIQQKALEQEDKEKNIQINKNKQISKEKDNDEDNQIVKEMNKDRKINNEAKLISKNIVENKQPSLLKKQIQGNLGTLQQQQEQEIIQTILQSDQISKFNVQIIESSEDFLSFNFSLDPGIKIIDSISKYKIVNAFIQSFIITQTQFSFKEIKVIECAWKKLLLEISDNTSYLKQEDKKIIKKGQLFSLIYKERNNSKPSLLNVKCFWNLKKVKAV